MRTMKILERLDRLLEPDLNKAKRAKEIEDLLAKLEYKRLKLETKIERAEHLAERAELARKQQICIEQLERGKRALRGARRDLPRF